MTLRDYEKVFESPDAFTIKENQEPYIPEQCKPCLMAGHKVKTGVWGLLHLQQDTGVEQTEPKHPEPKHPRC